MATLAPPTKVDVLVVGGGPAGMAAAIAASARARVAVLDDNALAGGQIWRQGVESVPQLRGKQARALLAFESSGAQLLAGRRVIHAPAPGVIHALREDTQQVEVLTYGELIIATGARERFLPFPGWTLPGVFGVGGLQALVKGGYSVRGKRVVVAGSGPLLLAIAAHLQQDGAQIVSVAEQAPLRRLLRFAAGLVAQPAKLAQAALLRTQLARVRYRTGCWPVSAQGAGKLTAVRLTDGKRTWTESCDHLACGFHLVPNTELAQLLGCALDGDCVQANHLQQTTVPHVFCAGEPTGIAGVDSALLQGRIAGLAATGAVQQAEALLPGKRAEQRFGRALERAFALRDELRRLPQPETIVCRCEDVRFGDLQDLSAWTEAKLATRCGMGPCQGRVCGPAVQTLFSWTNSSVRPPLFPVPLGALCAELAAEDL